MLSGEAHICNCKSSANEWRYDKMLINFKNRFIAIYSIAARMLSSIELNDRDFT